MNKIITIQHLDAITTHLKANKQQIVFTNGCFDLLHEGHLHLLQQAKQFGDILIVAVNTDASIKRLKGNERPIETLAIRLQHLANLAYVDFVIAFDEDTPLQLIEQIQPNILVKGSDYKNKTIVGSDIVLQNKGKVILVDILEGYSTTNKIKQNIKK
ncbi:MAG: D-glycero-beta-D-manno-heptose 1-phosphate adenylyltransferase [Chitinophagales bacterium]|nr:D-glycero-beta-D-manno-heptose 1-phosphate adenylyltransferase [Chitinophagales bacterium]